MSGVRQIFGVVLRFIDDEESSCGCCWSAAPEKLPLLEETLLLLVADMFDRPAAFRCDADGDTGRLLEAAAVSPRWNE